MLPTCDTAVRHRVLRVETAAAGFTKLPYAVSGAKLATALDHFSNVVIEIVRKPTDQLGFAVHPRRWVIERLFAWLGRNRRLAKDSRLSRPSSMPPPPCSWPAASLDQHEC